MGEREMEHQPDTTRLRTTQYGAAGNFNARVALHRRFRTNPYGFNRWLFDRLLRLPGESRVLELGCGPGWLWRGNVARIPACWATLLTDFSAGMVREARGHLGSQPRIHFAVTDAQALPFARGHFDAVVANHMLYHVPDRQRAYTEIARVLRPGGRLFAATFGAGHMRELEEIVARFSARPETARLPTRFRLENGHTELARRFADVTVEHYPDHLVVTEAEPFIAYVRSRSRPLGETAADSAERLARLRAYVADEIATHGAIHITAEMGLLTAMHR
jgi:SAM-dependent methyltransferase